MLPLGPPDELGSPYRAASAFAASPLLLAAPEAPVSSDEVEDFVLRHEYWIGAWAQFAGPRFFVRVAGLEMHPLDGVSREKLLKDELGLGYCNITKCCTEVCPEDIHITDNAIIPLKERVVDRYYDPLVWLWRKIRGRS